LIPSHENAILAIAQSIETIVPAPYWACFIRFPVVKSEALFFGFAPSFDQAPNVVIELD
jgi:hypothetical protein